MKRELKLALNLIGALLAIGGIVFVGLRLQTYGAQLNLLALGMSVWVGVLVLSLVYGMANPLLAWAWWQLLGLMGDQPPKLTAIRVYGLSQLVKYVPGNVLQLAGRQALGMAQGIGARPLLKSMVLELILLAVAGLLFACLILPRWLDDFTSADSLGLMLVATAVLLVNLYRRWARPVAWAFLAFVLFLWVSGAVFVVLLELVQPLPGDVVLPILGAFILAWLAGFLTPGAPAGVGVRELVLLVLLEGMVPSADLLVAVLLGRVVTVLGDIWFFVGALGLPVRQHGS